MSDLRRTALIVMAKAPEPGLAKTRLIPALGAQGAALLAGRLLEHTLKTVCQTTAFSHVELCVAPTSDHPAFAPLKSSCLSTNERIELHFTSQGDGDLGGRMQRAFERTLINPLARFDAAVMIGTDAPDITPEHLDQAAHDLTVFDAVFIPALDGGYTLIGLRQVMPEIFADMPWSTADVMSRTRQRLTALGMRWHEYPPMIDIDEPDDLQHLPVSLVK